MFDAGKTVQQLFEKHGLTRIKGLTHESAGVVAVVQGGGRGGEGGGRQGGTTKPTQCSFAFSG